MAAGLSGYLLLILEVFGVGLLLRPLGVPASLSLLMVWCAQPGHTPRVRLLSGTECWLPEAVGSE